jgi:hypothetical protein
MSEYIELPKLRPYARQGKAYYAELRAILKEIRHRVLTDVKTLRRQGKRVTIRDVCVFALRYELNLKAMFDLLEDENVLPCGTYERLKDRGMRPMTALRGVYAEMQEATK